MSAITRASYWLSAVAGDRWALFAEMNVGLDDDPYSTRAQVEVG